MATLYKRATPRKTAKSIPEWQVKFLKDGQKPEPVSPEFFFIFGRDDQRLLVWKKVREEVLSQWVKDYPGSRPWAWWRFDSPRMALLKDRPFVRDRVCEPRRKLSGAGKPLYLRYKVLLPEINFGIPQSWYGYNLDDPPVYESQASYLKRLDLLLKNEEKRLTTEDFEPETIIFDD